MFFLDPESKYERIFEFETMFLSCLFKELLPFENYKLYRNVLKNKKLSNKTTLKLRLESRFTESVLMTKYERIFEFKTVFILLI